MRNSISSMMIGAATTKAAESNTQAHPSRKFFIVIGLVVKEN
jgi:hypothetical protein